MNKKGDLLNNALELIIAVIGIALLVVAVVLIYKVYVNEENENAKRVINFVEAKINQIKEGQSAEFIVQGFQVRSNSNPLSLNHIWILTRWNLDSQYAKYRPEKCAFENCICICKVTLDRNLERAWDFFFTWPSEKREELTREVGTACQENGFCRFFDGNTIYFPDGGINVNNGFFSLKVDKSEKRKICVSATGRSGEEKNTTVTLECNKNAV